jgi:periplasmic divalent cation tolerance protein
VRSIYRFRGAVEDESEVLLVIKTRADRVDALAERLRALHPYEVPELLVLPTAGGLAPYLDWVRAETQP